MPTRTFLLKAKPGSMIHNKFLVFEDKKVVARLATSPGKFNKVLTMLLAGMSSGAAYLSGAKKTALIALAGGLAFPTGSRQHFYLHTTSRGKPL